MPRFYWKLLRRTPFLLWESAKKWNTVAGIATLCLLGFGVRVAWMPWWLVFLPIVLLFLYGLMKANHEEFRKIEQGRNESRTTLKTLEQGLQELGVNITGDLDKQIAKTKQLTNELRNGRLEEELRETKQEL